MSSFDELGLSDALVEALAAEGIERPTALQSSVIPVLRRGTSVLTEAGRGAGTLLTYGTALVDRIVAEESTGVLVMSGTAVGAAASARSLARIAQPLGVSVAAVGSVFADASDATIIFGTPSDIMRAVEGARLKLDRFDTWVVDGLTPLSAITDPAPIDTLAEQLGKDALGVVVDLPLESAAEGLAERHLRRVMHVPPRSSDTPKPSGKTIYYRVASEQRSEALLALVTGLRTTGTRVAVLFATEDQVADVGDYLELHGHGVGALGDEDAGVWISVDDAEVLGALGDAEGPIVVVCYQPPRDRSLLDVGSRDSHEWIALATPGEMAHLRHTAEHAGWDIRAAPPSRSAQMERGLRDVAAKIEARMEEGRLEPYALLVEELLENQDAAELAAAALALWTEGHPSGSAGADGTSAAPGARSWAKLFLTVGDRDGVRTGDLLGAVTGEAGVSSESVGKIDLRESHSIIEVDSQVADQIIKAVNGTSIRGRSVRVDYDRPADKRSSGRTHR